MAQPDPLPETSSTEPAWAASAQACYRDVLEALHRGGISCAVGGAFAIQKHTGIWRSTKDLDLLLVASAVPEALRWLRREGFETYIEDPVWLAKARRGDHFVDLITGMGNAALMVEASWIERAMPDTILGTPCKVLRSEELIASKLFVMRRERFDGSDVVHLVRACGERLDWDHLLQLTDPHWELLFWALVLFAYVYPAHTDLVPQCAWNLLTGRFGEQIRNPNKSEPFRGSLVDPKMFAIDVNEWGERNLYRELCERHPCLLQPDDSAIGSTG